MTCAVTRWINSRLGLRLEESESGRGDTKSVSQSLLHVIGGDALTALDHGDVGLIHIDQGGEVDLR